MTTETKPNDVITGFNGLTKREYLYSIQRLQDGRRAHP